MAKTMPRTKQTGDAAGPTLLSLKESAELLRSYFSPAADSVPEGWYTVDDYREQWSSEGRPMSRSGAQKLLNRRVVEGMADMQTFRIVAENRLVLIKHYRVVSRETTTQDR